MKKEKEKRKADYRHYIAIAITVIFALLAIFVFNYALGRTIEGARDLGLSVAFYFCEMFGRENAVVVTVTELPKIPFFARLPLISAPTAPLPEAWADFQANWGRYWQLWATKENFLGYLSFLGQFVYQLCRWLVVLIPLFVVVFLLLNRFLQRQNNDYDKDSRPLRLWKKISSRTYRPVKAWLMGFWAFLKDHKRYLIAWAVIWSYSFDLIAAALEFFAYYFYFVMAFDFASLYTQVYKLLLDLSVPFMTIPLWAWACVGFLLFDRFRKKFALQRLEHFEMRNRGFINARPIVFMVCGTMGKKKTTLITDMALSQEVMFRDKAFEKILENDLKFPYFPWINLENELKLAMEHHEVYNLATVRKFVAKKAMRWRRDPMRARIFGYDYERFGTEYDDKLKVVDVWDVIEIYAQLYFIYVIQSSLLIANYSVRADGILNDLGNFPLWNSDFFRRDSRLMESFSRHAHILDFDSLRLGRKVIEENRNANSFEFGVVLITEVGKERGNKVELSEKKKSDTATNQKNDNFNGWLKMVRHSATVDNFPFVRVITDEQRPESWGADARDLCEIVHVQESGETRLAMPFFSLAELLYSWLFGRFSGLYYRYRFIRSDNTLTMYLLKSATAQIFRYYSGIYNRFGYCRLRVRVESGTQDGEYNENNYFLMSKKIYSKRFSTDCFSDFFTEKALRSPVGIDDLKEYVTEKATFAELGAQHSYFISDLFDGLHNS